MSDETDFVEEVSAKKESCSLILLSNVEEQFRRLKMADNTEGITLEEGLLVRKPHQMEQVREDQVVNNAGGFVFKVSDESRIRRFLILGTASGSYHHTPQELTMENTKDLMDMIENGKGYLILKEIYEVNRQNRNPKMPPMIFALALCARYHVHDALATKEDDLLLAYSKYIQELHRSAFAILPEVCRIPTHLFEFVSYCEAVSKSTANFKNKQSSTGWGKMMRNAINSWYMDKTPEKLAMFLTKYPQREGWSHRDLFRLSHPKLQDESGFESRKDRLEMEQVFRYVVKGDLVERRKRIPEELRGDGLGEVKKVKEEDVKVEETDDKPKKGVSIDKKVDRKTAYTDEQIEAEDKSKSLDLIATYLKLKHEKSEEAIAAAIKEHGLVREHLPTDCLNSKLVWESLFDARMPLTALIRNLGKMSVVGCLDQARVESICARLNDEDELKKARIHPLNLLIARATYIQGRGDKGSLTWIPDGRISSALEAGFYKAFCNAPVTGKRYCLALDVSGSMSSPVASSVLTCREAASAMSLINLRNEKDVKCVAFCDTLTELPFTEGFSLDQMNDHVARLHFGATDCGLPMLWAMEKNLEFDVFIVYTDNETWAGQVHPFEAIKQYREKMNIPDAKVIVMAMQAVDFTIADPRDPGMLDVVGFDSAVPQIIHEFVMGNL